MCYTPGCCQKTLSKLYNFTLLSLILRYVSVFKNCFSTTMVYHMVYGMYNSHAMWCLDIMEYFWLTVNTQKSYPDLTSSMFYFLILKVKKKSLSGLFIILFQKISFHWFFGLNLPPLPRLKSQFTFILALGNFAVWNTHSFWIFFDLHGFFVPHEVTVPVIIVGLRSI